MAAVPDYNRVELLMPLLDEDERSDEKSNEDEAGNESENSSRDDDHLAHGNSKSINKHNIASASRIDDHDTSPFRFQDLPAELRERILVLAVNVSLIGPKLEAHPAAGIGSPRSITWGLDRELRCGPRPCADLVFVYQGPRLWLHSKPAKAVAPPAIMSVSKVLRGEALPVYFKVNDFLFYNCPVSRVLVWIFKVAGKYKKYLRWVLWQGGGVL